MTEHPPNVRCRDYFFDFDTTNLSQIDQSIGEQFYVVKLVARTWSAAPTAGTFDDYLQLDLPSVPVESNTSTACPQMVQLPLAVGHATDGQPWIGSPVTILPYDPSRKWKLPPLFKAQLFGRGVNPTAVANVSDAYVVLEALLSKF